MSETKMPAAEVEAVVMGDDEHPSYELAFHILPTVAEGEVPAVFDKIKTAITKAGGSIHDEEAAQRFDLAYEIIKHMEGKNRRFTSAYFGWIRFTAESNVIEQIVEAVDSNSKILRHLLIRLTKIEEQNPFRFHESLQASHKKVVNIEEKEVVDEEVAEDDVADAELDEAVEEKDV